VARQQFKIPVFMVDAQVLRRAWTADRAFPFLALRPERRNLAVLNRIFFFLMPTTETADHCLPPGLFLHGCFVRSIVHPFACVGQLLLGSLRIPRCGVEAFVAKNLRQAHEIIAVVCEELVRHRMPEQVGIQLDPGQGAVLVAQCSHASVGHRPSLADEHPWTFDGRAAIEVCLKRMPSRER
jgi:hypothetical protein